MISDIPTPNFIPYPTQTPMVLNYTDVVSQFGDMFILRMELGTVAFLGVMLYLQYYTKSLVKAHKDTEMSRNDKTLCFISDVLFLPAVAFVLSFVGYETGWF